MPVIIRGLKGLYVIPISLTAVSATRLYTCSSQHKSVFFGNIINKRNQNVAHILRNVRDKALNKTSTLTTEGQAMTSHPMNYFKSISKFVLQPDYCVVKRPHLPPKPFISFVKNA